MSQIKHMLEMDDQRRQCAVGLLIDAEIAEPCWAHGDLGSAQK